MKQFVIAGALVCCGLFQTWSQVAMTVDTPVIAPSTVFVIGSPAIAAPTTTTAVVPANVTLQTLSDALVMLQTNLEQTLPVVAVFNDNFDFISLSDNGEAFNSTGPAPGNFSSNLGTNLAVNLGVNAAMSTGPGLFNSPPRVTGSPPVLSQGLSATSFTRDPGLSAVPFTRDTLRALLILQNDLERMLSLVNVINSGTTNLGGPVNLFGAVR
jgi:hypothetical protein